MTRTELELLNILMAVNVHLETTELFFDEITVDEMPDEMRDEVAAYKKRTKELNKKLRNCVIAKFESLLTEEK